ncbi:QueT transporter family protein [Romboutsia weinsteinii]|uniref:QueT transporter family protein n=1 Tax=Romboutsia weinsteinii TaxID=2020949 RepID=A0A371J5N6_9FIRM|nr:QueT transporter family protein [Romboutsia weinsteinii]RDY27998.1 QueT transporter family protein [Romboutsia weinsteinii]
MRQNTKKLVTTAVVASTYAAITLALSFISYGPIQFRIAEVMVLLPFIRKEYILGLTLGCFLANVISPYGVADTIFGTTATFISTYLVYLTSKIMKDKKGSIFIASLWPTIVNAIIIGAELNIFFGMPFLISMLEVGFGQFVVITIIGVPLFKILENKYYKLIKNAF